MSSTRSAARRAALSSVLSAAFAALRIPVLPAPEAEAGTRAKARSACVNRLCTETRDGARRCRERDTRARIAKCFITRAARHFRQSRSQAFYIAYRESRYNWRATNSSSGAAGLYQFMPRTWNYTPYRAKSPYHPRWAALAAMWMWKNGYKSHWSTW